MWGIIVSIIIGALAGFIASRIMGKGMGLLLSIIVGIVGGALGSWLFGLIGATPNPSFWAACWLVVSEQWCSSSSFPSSEGNDRLTCMKKEDDDRRPLFFRT